MAGGCFPKYLVGSTSSLGVSRSTLNLGKTIREKGNTNLINCLSVQGFSLEFALLNPQGFLFYGFYSVAGFVDPHIGAGTVRNST